MKRRGNKEGSIFKTKDGSWVAQILMGYNKDGKPKRRRIQRKTRAEVQQILDEIKSQLLTGTYIESSKLKFNDWLEQYLDIHCKLSVRPSTFSVYQALAKNHIYPAFTGLTLQEISTHHIQLLISEKANTLSASTIKQIAFLISKALKRAVQESRLLKNPAELTTLPRKPAIEVNPLSESELQKLLAVAKGHRLYHALLLVVTTGIRRGELLGLQWQDIDFENNVIRIVRSFVKAGSIDIIQEPKTTASKRVINVPESVMCLLKEEKEKSQPNNPWVVPVTNQRTNTEYLPVAPRNFSRLYGSWCKKAGVNNVRLHALRHTYASLMLSSNVHMKTVQAQLGHSDIKVTLNRYSHLTFGLQQEAANKMGERLAFIAPELQSAQTEDPLH